MSSTTELSIFTQSADALLRGDHKSILLSIHGDMLNEFDECFPYSISSYMTINQARDLAKEILRLVESVEHQRYEEMVNSCLDIPPEPKRYLRVVPDEEEGCSQHLLETQESPLE